MIFFLLTFQIYTFPILTYINYFYLSLQSSIHQITVYIYRLRYKRHKYFTPNSRIIKKKTSINIAYVVTSTNPFRSIMHYLFYQVIASFDRYEVLQPVCESIFTCHLPFWFAVTYKERQLNGFMSPSPLFIKNSILFLVALQPNTIKSA